MILPKGPAKEWTPLQWKEMAFSDLEQVRTFIERDPSSLPNWEEEFRSLMDNLGQTIGQLVASQKNRAAPAEPEARQ